MKIKTIAKCLDKKINEWLTSITDESLRARVRGRLNRNRRLKAILFILMLWACVGCKPKIKHGLVIEKYSYDGYYYTTYIFIGKIMVPTTNYSPPRYCVKIRGLKKRDTVTSEIDMYYNDWLNQPIGDTATFN